MFTPTYVQLKYWYYPTGNTPAVNFLRHLPPGVGDETVNVLSLACGDPRNILFSLWCDQGDRSNRSLRFTCCDVEPAVLARNIVLLTLIVNGHTGSPLWEIFYNFYIPESSLTILRQQASCLLNASDSIEAWATSPYGKYIHFVDKATLQHLRQYWAHYASENEWSQARVAIRKRFEEIGDAQIYTGLRAAGSFWFHALETMAYVYRKYWETGVAGGNTEDLVRLGSKGQVNPMFAVSSAPAREFAVHYGSDPLLGFHLDAAFQESFHKNRDLPAQASRAVAVAKSQFQKWSESFRDYVDRDRLVVKFFHGEALALSHELQLALHLDPKLFGVARTYTRPWTACPLLLDGHVNLGTQSRLPQEPFHVIDTSNLGDHVGFINILSATIPLLHHSPSSVLYTESLLMAAEDNLASLSTILGSDVATFSLLVGVAPLGLLTGVTLDDVANEAAMSTLKQNNGYRQYRMRIPWKRPEYGDTAVVRMLEGERACQIPIKYEARSLADYLYDLYRKMFAHEDPTKLFARQARISKGHQYSVDQQRYTRAGVAALLRLVKARANVDWEEVMLLFDNLVNTDRSLIVGSNSLQELYMHLHLLGVWTSKYLQCSPVHLRDGLALPLRSSSKEKDILGQQAVPPIVHIVLVIPRRSLRIFTEKAPDKLGTPALHIAITQTGGQSYEQYENCFYSFSSFFGKIRYDKDTMDASVIEEDENGWLGNSDLVVICAVPTFGLLLGPRNGIRAALKINTTPENWMLYGNLGMRMAVFETGFEEEQRLFICRHAPRLNLSRSISMQKEWIRLHSHPKESKQQILVKLNSQYKATDLQYHVHFPDSSVENSALTDGALVKVVPNSPCTLLIQVGDSLKHTVRFPFPIHASRAKTRVARKSSWIEVEVPLFVAPDQDTFDSWTQVILESNRPPVCWIIPRVNLEIQPLITFPKDEDASWITKIIGSSLSDVEDSQINLDHATSTNAKLDLKQSLNIVFASFAGANPARKKPIITFQLCLEEKRRSCHTVIFATSVHHDLDTGSIVMEAYVVPFTIPRVKELHSALSRLQDTMPTSLVLSNAESTLWKRMLPALAERCRTWDHGSKCEYKRHGVPISTKEDQSPLCTCGESQISGPELAKLGVKEWAPFAKYATRIAIAPIYPVPYIEPSKVEMRKRKTASATAGAASPATSHASGPSKLACDNCGGTNGPLKACGGCGKARYCGHACQKTAWKEHKRHCVRD